MPAQKRAVIGAVYSRDNFKSSPREHTEDTGIAGELYAMGEDKGLVWLLEYSVIDF